MLVQNLSTVPGPILNKCWTGNGAIWLADISYWPSDLTYWSSSDNILSWPRLELVWRHDWSSQIKKHYWILLAWWYKKQVQKRHHKTNCHEIQNCHLVLLSSNTYTNLSYVFSHFPISSELTPLNHLTVLSSHFPFHLCQAFFAAIYIEFSLRHL